MDVELNWREIYDCKIPTEPWELTRDKARTNKYPYFCFNWRIYNTFTGEQVTCIGTIKE